MKPHALEKLYGKDCTPFFLPHLGRQFHAIEVDYPWAYRDRGYNGYASVQEYRIHCPYETMSLDEVRASGSEIMRLAHPVEAHLWMWATKDFLYDALAIGIGWGWHFRQCYPWIKTDKKGVPLTGGMGWWGRNAVEYLLLFTNNLSFRPLNATREPNYIFAPRQRGVASLVDGKKRLHSVKPDAAYALIARNTPGPRLSIFQTIPREGFTCWGAEMGHSDK